jgi:hypothetical protein
MNERERLQAEIAALQARLDALPPEPDLSEAVDAFRQSYLNEPALKGSVKDGLRACHPVLRKAYGHNRPAWPDEETLRGMVYAAWTDHASYTADRFLAHLREWQEANNG